MDKLRIDKWLWAARFFKTRSLACDEVDKGRVQVWVQGQLVAVKPARELKPGDQVVLKTADGPRTVRVLALSSVRGPAPVAQALYEETAESLQARQHAVEQRRLAPEPAHALTQGRPTKRDRRDLSELNNPSAPSWNDRWSASIDER